MNKFWTMVMLGFLPQTYNLTKYALHPAQCHCRIVITPNCVFFSAFFLFIHFHFILSFGLYAVLCIPFRFSVVHGWLTLKMTTPDSTEKKPDENLQVKKVNIKRSELIVKQPMTPSIKWP